MAHQSVLILGANGRFGLAAAQAFAAAGWTVLAQTRRPLAAGMPAGTRQVGAALNDVNALVHAAAGVSAVVYAVNPVYTRWNEELLPMARAGMDAAQRLGATFMLPGNVYNFGQSMPALLTETTPEQPSTDKGQLRTALEAEMAARAAGGLRSVVVRAGDFYGGGPGSWFDMVIVKSLAKGKLVYPGAMNLVHAWAYLPDLARCFVALATLAADNRLAPATRFHFPGHTLTGRQLLDALERSATELGLAPPRGLRRSTLPWGLLRALAWAVPMWRELVKMQYLWRVPHALDGRLLAQTIGTLPVTPLAQALRATLLASAGDNALPLTPAAPATGPTR